MHPTQWVGPTVASPEWWEAISVSSEAIESRIETVNRKGGTFRLACDVGTDRAFPIRGDQLDYIEGFDIRIVLAFPPPGFVLGSGDADFGGVLTEVWMGE